ncbi:MAG: DUF393 domain-containing protein [Bacteroidetes bacterium]|nr:DUF393 domain-containing protein [Bacteroidota bacterium]
MGRQLNQSGPDLLLLYDGWCGLCNGSVRFILRHDRRRTMRFAPLQGSTAGALLQRYPQLRSADSLIVIETSEGTETLRLRSDGLLRIAEYLGGGFSLFLLFRFIPRSLRDSVYDLVARLRYRIAPRYSSCPVPSPEHRSRFLE